MLAVPCIGGDALTGPAAEIASIIGLDNPALDIRLAKADTASQGDPDGIRAVLADAAAKRPAGAPSAIVVPLLASAHPATILTIRDAISASGANACISEVFNTNALLAEVLHIRLADAGLARADRVRMFSITTSADGILVVTVGGPEASGMASVTSVLLAARLALPVLPASLDSPPSIEQQAMQLQAMGVTRIAIAPCVIGPEVATGAVEEATSAVGGKCAAPLGAHGNIVKLIVAAYGQALSQLKTPEEPVGSERPRHQAGALINVTQFSHAQAAISTRLRSPSLPWMLARWVLTVLSEMNSSAATSVLVRPLATARTTSVSRSDRHAAVVRVALTGARRRSRRSVMDGEISASPALAARTASASRAGPASLSMKPTAPARSAP